MCFVSGTVSVPSSDLGIGDLIYVEKVCTPPVYFSLKHFLRFPQISTVSQNRLWLAALPRW